jgi:Mn2+/Fe2+ NRAMP family transporter
MSDNDDSLAAEKELLASVANKGAGAKLGTYAKLCGPGWLQSAITLGGGSLIGALSLGAIGGTKFMWVQPLAMILGIIMLSAIAYVTLSTGERPFQAINKHVSPVLGWGWLLATMLANMVWCLPQFNLAYGAIAENLAPSLPDAGKEGSTLPILIVSSIALAIGIIVVFAYGKGSRGVLLFERLLKIFVGLIVICFVGVIIRLTLADGSPLDWGSVLGGFIPDFGALFRPAESFQSVIGQLDAAAADKWTETIVDKQRDSIITAFGTAVGINMTFLLPYSMLKRKWGKEHRGLAIFDLSTGLFIPFVIATGCLVIATATQFHNNPTNFDYTKSASLVAEAKAQLPAAEFAALESNSATYGEKLKLIYIALPNQSKANAKLELMSIRPSQLELARSLAPFTGEKVAQYVFGFGVLAMAISTIVILMLINGFALCEAMNQPDNEKIRRIGCLIAGIVGFFGPLVWGTLKAYLVVPTSVFGFTLLPIAYITFLLLMNSKSLLGDARPEGARRIRWNVLMVTATVVATIGAGWASHSKIGWWGPALIVAFGFAAAITHRGGKVKA